MELTPKLCKSLGPDPSRLTCQQQASELRVTKLKWNLGCHPRHGIGTLGLITLPVQQTNKQKCFSEECEKENSPESPSATLTILSRPNAEWLDTLRENVTHGLQADQTLDITKISNQLF